MNSEGYNKKTATSEKDRERFLTNYQIDRFPVRLKNAMTSAGIPSNNQLAKLTELSEATVRKYLKGETYPTLDRLALLADACGCSLAWLASGDAGVVNKEEALAYKDDKRVSEIENILAYFTDEQKMKFFRVVYTKGIAAILKLDDTFDAQFLALPDAEKERLMALHEAKKGEPKNSQMNDGQSLAG